MSRGASALARRQPASCATVLRCPRALALVRRQPASCATVLLPPRPSPRPRALPPGKALPCVARAPPRRTFAPSRRVDTLIASGACSVRSPCVPPSMWMAYTSASGVVGRCTVTVALM